MKRLVWPAMGLVALMSTAVAATSIKSNQDKLSYAMGYETGKAFKSHDISVKPTVYALGLQDGLTGARPQLSEKQIRTVLTNFQKESVAKIAKQMKAMADENKKAGDAFLEKNKAKPGVQTLQSGLQYKVIKAGKGPVPTENDVVVVNYEGKLLSGKVFDSSYKRGKPVTLPVRGVIKGWQQALTMMKTGATWELYIPSDLAYGTTGAPGVIGPNDTLIFKVQLLRIKKK